MPGVLDQLQSAIRSRTARVGIVGLGYVGLPLVRTFVAAGFRVLGFDCDAGKVAKLAAGQSYIGHIADAWIAESIAAGAFEPTSEMARLGEPDAILICVPTPLTPANEPDLTYVEQTARQIAAALRPGQLVVLESTTYPGTTRQVVLPILQAGRTSRAVRNALRGAASSDVGTQHPHPGPLTEGEGAGNRSPFEFFLAYSPEREDPGNPSFSTSKIPKIVGGIDDASRDLAVALYSQAVVEVVPVSSCEVAEACKILENVYRAVNIAMVNELKLLFERIGLDIWEVIAAARTKPFGFQAFYPGPGLGGHCIPIDPFYLSWLARQHGQPTRLIELAGEINSAMPAHVVERVAAALQESGKHLRGSRVAILGVAYKKDVDDPRESPAFRIMELLEERGAILSYHDPHIPQLPKMRHYRVPDLASQPLMAEFLAGQDCAVIVTDHSAVDYGFVVRHSHLVMDTRNADGRRQWRTGQGAASLMAGCAWPSTELFH